MRHENKGLVTAARNICTALPKTGASNQNTSLVIIKHFSDVFLFTNVCKMATWFCKDVEAACVSQQCCEKLQTSKNL